MNRPGENNKQVLIGKLIKKYGSKLKNIPDCWTLVQKTFNKLIVTEKDALRDDIFYILEERFQNLMWEAECKGEDVLLYREKHGKLLEKIDALFEPLVAVERAKKIARQETPLNDYEIFTYEKAITVREYHDENYQGRPRPDLEFVEKVA